MLLESITWVTDYIGMAISLGLAFYLLPRGRSNRLAFLLTLFLVSLGLYYIVKLLSTEIDNASFGTLRTFTVIFAITTIFQLTNFLLPPSIKPQHSKYAQGVILFALISSAILIVAPNKGVGNTVFINTPSINSPGIVIGVFETLVSLGVLYNLTLIARSGTTQINRGFMLSLVLAALITIYGVFGTLFNVPIPRFIATLLMLSSFLLIGYSLARHQTFIERRILLYDLPISFVAMAVVLTTYLIVARWAGLSTTMFVGFSVLLLATHPIYAWLREGLQRRLMRQQQANEAEIRGLIRKTQEELPVDQVFDRALAIICQSLQADGGFIAVNVNGDFLVQNEINTLPVGTWLAREEVILDEVSQPPAALASSITWLSPGFASSEQSIVVGLGPRTGLRSYTNHDLEWLQDIADHIAVLHYASSRQEDVTGKVQTEALLSTLMHQPPQEMTTLIEEGLRHMHDFVWLGSSDLVTLLNARGNTHIEQGKSVQQVLLDTLETLRPAGERPAEPLPRSWRDYTILHDAYVEEVDDREIMARLYISESTFYRSRRKAVRGITRAVMEIQTA